MVLPHLGHFPIGPFITCLQSRHFVIGTLNVKLKENYEQNASTATSLKELHAMLKANTVDFESFTKAALAMDADEIHILGATGTRLDHVLGTIRVLGLALEKKVPCYLVDPNNRIRLADEKTVLKKEEQYGTYVSILPFTTSLEGLTLKGFKYPLEDAVMEGYHALGVSNEIVEEEAVISMKDGVAIVIESRDRE